MAVQGWEYKLQILGVWKSINIPVGLMNELGENGWELASSIPDVQNGNTEKVLLYFKRPKMD